MGIVRRTGHLNDESDSETEHLDKELRLGPDQRPQRDDDLLAQGVGVGVVGISPSHDLLQFLLRLRTRDGFFLFRGKPQLNLGLIAIPKAVTVNCFWRTRRWVTALHNSSSWRQRSPAERRTRAQSRHSQAFE